MTSGRLTAFIRLLLGLWLALGAAPAAIAAISVAASSSVGNGVSSAVSSLSLSNPGSQSGDVLLAQLVVGASGATITAPSGWSSFWFDTGTGVTQQLFYRIAGASEAGSYSFSFASARASGGLLVLRGVDTTGATPIAHSQGNNGSSSTLTALAANVTTANSLAVRYFAFGRGNNTLSGPATQHYSPATGAVPNGVAASASSAIQTAVGQSGDATATAGGSSAAWLAATVVLAPSVLPVLSWSLDEATWTGAAGEVLDASGNGLAGTVVNTAQTSNTAPALPTVNGDGTCRYGGFTSSSQQYVQHADNALLDLQGSFSIGLWVKPSSLPASGLMTILSKDENYEFHLKPDGKINWWWQTTAGGTNQLDSTASVPVGQWSHVLIRYAPGDQRIYINGALAGSASFSGTPVANTDPLQLGNDQGFAGRYFNGALDELRIYAVALSTAQISALVQARHSCPLALQCVNDNFNRSGLGADWAVTTSGGSFGVPVIVSDRMRLTNSSNNVATSSTLQRLFPAAGNYVQMQFKHYAYNGSGADGVAVVLSDASVTPQAGSYGGPLGYGTRGTVTTPGFAGGWLGVGVDEYGNFSTEGGGATANGPGRRLDSVALRGSGAPSRTSGYSYIAGTAANLSPGIDVAGSTAGPGHTYRITMDGRVSGSALVTVERDSGAGFVALSGLGGLNVAAAAGQAPLPANFYLSFTGSSGGSTNTHELDDLQVCASQINPIEQQIDHFELVHAGNALTCNPLDVLVRACLDASCATPYTGSVTVNLTPSGWVGGNSQTFSGGSKTLQLRNNTASTVTLGVSGSTPSLKPFSQTLCSSGGALSSSCTVPFADSGFIVTVPDMLAAKLTTGSIRAVKKNDATQACVPGFPSGARTVQFSSAYVSPNTGTQPVVVNGTAVTAALTNVALDFDAAASAPLNVRYDDAGLMTLNARYAPTSGDENGLVMIGSDPFISSPAGFCVEALTPLSAPTTALPACANSACTVYQKAGLVFPMRLRAKAWADGESDTELCDNLDTANFRQTSGNLPLSASMLDGGANGVLAVGAVDFSTAADVTISQAVSEVGRFQFTLGSALTTYQGLALASSSSAAVGRFTPDHFDVQISQYAPACAAGASTYAGLNDADPNLVKIGQPFLFAGSVTALNATGGITSNYDKDLASYARLQGGTASIADYVGAPPVLPATPVAAVDGVALIDNTLSFDGGVSAITLSGAATYQFNAPRDAYLVSLMATASDSDGVTGTSTQTAALDFRLGQAHIGNAHGSELQALRLPFTAGYFNGSGYVANPLDSCTAFDPAGLGGYQGQLAAGETALSYLNAAGLVAAPPVNVQAGSSLAGGYLLSAPGVGNDGSVRLTYTTPTWLQFDWDGNGSLEPASGLATFGIYKGATPLIFRRELYR
ncbi:MAG: LamG-like jellyroll fold domain-containing protein [Pseudomonas sp.]|uniref:DUF6701 domain-containing protein n=1 Tax=Pseudomonas sp. TaxID=306 RepID=UPI00273665B3|nr:DUF6701 domain-containing protein [Pseudomonas sp.]MDP3845773.1 LamG-like jellyroll fold domain-containing protein [Pseudomonas sp.]